MNRNLSMKRGLLILLVALAAVAAPAQGPDAVLAGLTKPTNFVNDYVGVFALVDRASLENYLREVEAKTTAEIAVVALKSLDGGEINDFATRLFEKWGIGQKGKDNGILLLAAIDDRKVRIEVGYGLEGLIPDAKAGRLLDENVIPLFKEGNVAGGLTRGAMAVAALILQDAGVAVTGAVPVQAAATAPATTEQGPLASAIFFLVFCAFIVFFGIAVKKGWIKSSGPGGGSSSGGRSSGGGSSSSGGGGFGGGSSGGGGASRGW